MRRITAVAACVVAAFCLSASPSYAQAEGSWMAMRSFSVPLGELQRVMMHIDSVVVPRWSVNPNVKQGYVAGGRFGAAYTDLVIVTVHETFEAINAPCGAPCEEWTQARESQVEEGSDEWNRRIEARNTFWGNILDAGRQIYWVPASRMK